MHRILIVFVSLHLCIHAFAQTKDMDTELSAFTEKLAASLKETGKKKVTVLDFTDLQGTPTGELGRYVAEQITVNFVMEKRTFTVLDRANLKSILAEHKLTATGLVDPANAKKLGQFAGVDAIILGTITPKGQNMGLTAKIITTDTAEVVGAARAEFKSDETVQKLVSKPSVSSTSDLTTKQPVLASKQFGNLNIAVEGIHPREGNLMQVDLVVQNKGTKESIAIALYHEACFVPPCRVRGSLTGADGTQFYADDSGLSGIRSMEMSPKGLTEVEPNGEIKASVAFRATQQPAEQITSFRLQLELVINSNYKASTYDNYRIPQEGLPPSCKINNLVLDIPTP